MTDLSRRSFLQKSPLVTAGIMIPVGSVGVALNSRPAETSEQAIHRLSLELHAEMLKVHEQGVELITCENTGCIIFRVKLKPRIREFVGAGWYEVEIGGKELPTEELWIEVSQKFPADPEHGRWFIARAKESLVGGPSLIQESWLRQILVRKIGGVA